MRVMYDSVSPAAIPADAEMVAGYVDGIFAWSKDEWDRFPNATKVTISAVGNRVAHVVDVEVGCVWPPPSAVPWVIRARAAGYDPTVYCNWWNDLPSVRQAFRDAGVAEPHYWVAKYDGVHEIPTGTIGKQHSAPEAPGKARAGGHYDVSSVADHWPGVDTEDDMSAEAEAKIADLHQAAVQAYNATGGKDGGGKGFGQLIAEIKDDTRDMRDALATNYLSNGEAIGKTTADIEAKLDRLDAKLDGLSTGTGYSLQQIAAAVVAEMKKEGN